ncbi:MAG: hypothetical protein PUJ80_08275 [Verrucomicrobiota bacterium]|nr:hypothetical protein [Verrucomicrobiota bacterium]
MKQEEEVWIQDSLANVGAYAKFGKYFGKAVEFLGRKDLGYGRVRLDCHSKLPQ